MLFPSKVNDTMLDVAAPAGAETSWMSPATRAAAAVSRSSDRFQAVGVAANLMRCIPARPRRVMVVLLCGHRSTGPPPFDAARGVLSCPAPMYTAQRSPAAGMGLRGG